MIRRWKFSVFIAGTAMILTSCHENSNGQSPEKNAASPSVKSEQPRPKIDIKVNRHFDEKGNLIGFDSTYSTYYSNTDPGNMPVDSLLSSFNMDFWSRQSFDDDSFTTRFFNDSLLYRDIFHDDFFRRSREFNEQWMRSMMKKHFFQQPGPTSKPRDENKL